MISTEFVLFIHQKVIKEFGGKTGLRDLNLLESAIGRAFQTFNEKDLYPTSTEKAVALFESIISNHPFVDGNKRVAYTVLRLLLLENGSDLKASEQEKYAFVISCAKGDLSYKKKLKWVNQRLKSTV